MSSDTPAGTGPMSPVDPATADAILHPKPLVTPDKKTSLVNNVSGYDSNGTHGFCYVNPPPPPPQQYLSQGPTQQQLDQQRKDANSMGLWFAGPVMGGLGAADRLAGGSEDSVESATEANVGLTSGMGVRGSGTLLPKRQGASPPPAGARVDMKKWTNADGTLKYPKNDGFAGTPTTQTMQPGDQLDRFGGTGGNYFAPAGGSFEGRGLPPSSWTDQPFNTYEVQKPFDAQVGPAQPAFDQPGGDPQIKTADNNQTLLDKGYLKEAAPKKNRHIADAEGGFKVVNVNPDFCKVGGQVVPFDIYREMPPERSNYAHTVHARGEKVLHVDSVIQGVIGNAGQGVSSGVSQGAGDTIILQGAPTVQTEGKRVARHLDRCDMNVKSH